MQQYKVSFRFYFVVYVYNLQWKDLIFPRIFVVLCWSDALGRNETLFQSFSLILAEHKCVLLIIVERNFTAKIANQRIVTPEREAASLNLRTFFIYCKTWNSLGHNPLCIHTVLVTFEEFYCKRSLKRSF